MYFPSTLCLSSLVAWKPFSVFQRSYYFHSWNTSISDLTDSCVSPLTWGNNNNRHHNLILMLKNLCVCFSQLLIVVKSLCSCPTQTSIEKRWLRKLGFLFLHKVVVACFKVWKFESASSTAFKCHKMNLTAYQCLFLSAAKQLILLLTPNNKLLNDKDSNTSTTLLN